MRLDGACAADHFEWTTSFMQTHVFPASALATLISTVLQARRQPRIRCFFSLRAITLTREADLDEDWSTYGDRDVLQADFVAYLKHQVLASNVPTSISLHAIAEPQSRLQYS